MNKLIKSSALLLSLLFCASSHAYANKNAMFSVDTIVYSDFKTTEPRIHDERLNTNLYGIGFSYFGRFIRHTGNWAGLEVDYYDDQFKNPAYQINGVYKYRIESPFLIDGIEFNFKAGLVNRLYQKKKTYYDGRSYLYDERESRFSVTPSITVAWTKHFTTEVIYFPEDYSENITDGYEMWMVKVGARF